MRSPQECYKVQLWDPVGIGWRDIQGTRTTPVEAFEHGHKAHPAAQVRVMAMTPTGWAIFGREGPEVKPSVCG